MTAKIAYVFVMAVLCLPGVAAQAYDGEVGMVSDGKVTSKDIDAEIASGITIESAQDLKKKQFNEDITDLMFNLKAFFIVNNEAEVELLEQRFDNLQVRQREWLGMKNEASVLFSNDIIVDGEKEEIVGEFHEEHEEVIEEYVELYVKVKDIELDARAKGTEESLIVAKRAYDLANKIKQSSLSFGLSMESNQEAEIGVVSPLFNKNGGKNNGASKDTSVGASAITGTKARAIAEEELDIDVTSVDVVQRNGMVLYTVEGVNAKSDGDLTLTTHYTVWVEAMTGIITQIDIDNPHKAETKITSNTDVSVGADASAKDTSAGSDGKVGVDVGIDGSIGY